MSEAMLIETIQTTLVALAGVACAAVAVRAFDREPEQLLTVESVIAELEQAFPSFRPETILFDHPDREKALVLDHEARRLAVVFAFGKQVTSRAGPTERMQFERHGSRLRLRLADLVTPDVELALPEQVPPAFLALFKQGGA